MGKTSNEVKKRYADKTFKKYVLTLRKKENAELIAKIEFLKAKGLSISEIIKQLILCNNVQYFQL